MQNFETQRQTPAPKKKKAVEMPGLMTEEEGRRGIYEEFGPAKQEIKQRGAYTGEPVPGLMSAEEKTTEDLIKLRRFDQYREEMKATTPDKLKKFISWCEESMAKDPGFKDQYMKLERESSELLLSKINIELTSHKMNADLKIKSYDDLKNLINLWKEKVREFELEKSAKAKEGINQYNYLIVKAEDIQRLLAY
jgi:hypothetical protein